MEIQIKIDKDQIKQLENRLGRAKNQLPRVLASAINDTVLQLRTRLVRDLAADIGSKISAVRRRTRVSKASVRTLSACLSISPSRIGLIDLYARQTPKGVSYRAGRGGKGFAEHAFIQTMRGGSLQVARRVSGQGPSGLVPRYPIAVLKGPSPAMIEEKGGYLPAHKQQAAEILNSRIKSKVDWILSKR
ncbi:MAG TPA: phage tail protein [Anaerohalosphaeraceae bacterium]|nr:phage tail protein [Anaerohalosphaeraceae bacterium]